MKLFQRNTFLTSSDFIESLLNNLDILRGKRILTVHISLRKRNQIFRYVQPKQFRFTPENRFRFGRNL